MMRFAFHFLPTRFPPTGRLLCLGACPRKDHFVARCAPPAASSVPPEPLVLHGRKRLTMYPSHPIPPPNHRFDDDDDDFDPDRLAHYDALACGIVSVQRARLMP